MLNILEGGVKFRSNDTQIPRTDHVERSLNVFGCRFGSRCHSPPWRTEQSQDEPFVLALENPIEAAALVVDSNQSPSNIFPILKKGGVFKPCRSTRHRPYSRLTPHLTHKTITLDGLGYGENILILELPGDNWLFSCLEDGKALIIYKRKFIPVCLSQTTAEDKCSWSHSLSSRK